MPEDETTERLTEPGQDDLPLEPGSGDEREGRRVDQGSASGLAGFSGTEATDFRVNEPGSPDEEEGR